jgi:hypothetical protein
MAALEATGWTHLRRVERYNFTYDLEYRYNNQLIYMYIMKCNLTPTPLTIYTDFDKCRICKILLGNYTLEHGNGTTIVIINSIV